MKLLIKAKLPNGDIVEVIQLNWDVVFKGEINRIGYIHKIDPNDLGMSYEYEYTTNFEIISIEVQP